MNILSGLEPPIWVAKCPPGIFLFHQAVLIFSAPDLFNDSFFSPHSNRLSPTGALYVLSG